MLRRILLASAGAMALAGTALAADLPPPPPPPPPPPLWTGFYIGANIGGTWGNSNTINTVTANLDPLNGLGLEAISNAASAGLATFNIAPQTVAFIGGGQIGYNYQFANSWVAGLEADIQGVSRNGNTSVFSNVNILAGSRASFKRLSPASRWNILVRSEAVLGSSRPRRCSFMGPAASPMAAPTPAP